MSDQQTSRHSASPVEGIIYVMRSVLIQLSGLAGILAFLTQMWNGAALEQSLYTGVITGGGVYVILLLTDVFLQRIIAAYTASLREQANAERQSSAEEPENSDREADSAPDRSESSEDESSSSAAAGALESAEKNQPTAQEMAAV